MTHEPMEHNGVSSVGEWHVVTQPHFNCPRGSFRPAVFQTECNASNCPHQCACHIEGSGVDPADCVCKGDWRRATAEEWVKTTTAPTANVWKDKRREWEREGEGGGEAMAAVRWGANSRRCRRPPWRWRRAAASRRRRGGSNRCRGRGVVSI